MIEPFKAIIKLDILPPHFVGMTAGQIKDVLNCELEGIPDCAIYSKNNTFDFINCEVTIDKKETK